jgi:non-heme chloroperoxidase
MYNGSAQTIRFSARDIEIVADRFANAGAPLVIFSHGGGQTRHSWRGAAEEVANLGFETLSIDLRGHGESGWAAPDKYDLTEFAEDLKALAREHAGRRAVALVGASLGGMISLIAAADPAAQISAVALVDVVPRVEMAGARRIRAFMQRYSHGFASLEEAAGAIAQYRGEPMTSDHAGLAKNLRRRADGRYYWHWDPRFLQNMPSHASRTGALESAARQYRGPLLLVHGLRSDIVGGSGVAGLRTLAPQMEYADVANAGHMVVNDRNDAFIGAVARFLTKHLAPRSDPVDAGS